MKNGNILEIKDLNISFATGHGRINIIRGVNLELRRGTTLAIVGESGSGKSVTVKSVMSLLPDSAKIESGEIWLKGKEHGEDINIAALNHRQVVERINGQRIAMVFQDPLTILNPTMTIGKQITEGMLLHGNYDKAEAWDKATKLLEYVGITEPDKRMKQFPHELSGGMRQRVVIAIALSCDADIVICDEPTTALDVTVQARILDLIESIQKERGLSVIYITHDLGVVAEVADTIAVMYAGQVVEYGSSNDIFYHPAHPYTWGLLSSIPDMDIKNDELYSIPGNPPDLSVPFTGDAFAPRNEYALKEDFSSEPELIALSDTHFVRSRLYESGRSNLKRPAALQLRIDRMREESRNA